MIRVYVPKSEVGDGMSATLGSHGHGCTVLGRSAMCNTICTVLLLIFVILYETLLNPPQDLYWDHSLNALQLSIQLLDAQLPGVTT